MREDSKKKSALKSFIWRIMGVLILGAVTYAYTGNWVTTSLITFIHHSTFLIVYYLHERAWFKIGWISKWQKYAKAFTYETLLGNVILGLITYWITGDVKQMTAITLTYIGIKHVIYVLNEFVWNKKVVYAYVVGDILHVGHLKHLRAAKKAGSHLVVGVLTEEAVLEKKSAPILSLKERMEMVAAVDDVDEVVQQYTYSSLDNVLRINPDILMESDSHDSVDIAVVENVVKKYGGKVIVTEYFDGQSSTKIKEKIKSEWKPATVIV